MNFKNKNHLKEHGKIFKKTIETFNSYFPIMMNIFNFKILKVIFYNKK
jgi:hypothetical protein